MAVQGDYGDDNRAFLQSLMARGSVTIPQGKKIIAHIESRGSEEQVRPHAVTDEQFEAYVSAANGAISAFDYEIRSTLAQDTSQRSRIYAFVNTTSDPFTQLATSRSADEIAYIKRLLDAMFETYNTRRAEVMAVTTMQASGLGRVSARQTQTQSTQSDGVNPLSNKEAEKLLTSLVAEGWLTKSTKNYYTLSPRALMELRHFLLTTYNDEEDDEDRVEKIKLCQGCRDIVTIGQRCSDLQCSARLHNVCVANFFRAQRTEACPICKSAWSGDVFVGERAARSQSDSARRDTANGRQSTAGPSQSQRPSARNTAVEEEEEEDESEDTDSE